MKKSNYGLMSSLMKATAVLLKIFIMLLTIIFVIGAIGYFFSHDYAATCELLLVAFILYKFLYQKAGDALMHKSMELRQQSVRHTPARQTSSASSSIPSRMEQKMLIPLRLSNVTETAIYVNGVLQYETNGMLDIGIECTFPFRYSELPAYIEVKRIYENGKIRYDL